MKEINPYDFVEISFIEVNVRRGINGSKVNPIVVERRAPSYELAITIWVTTDLQDSIS